MDNIYAKCILITGTPGTGKTTFAKYLSKKYDIPYWDIEKINKKYPIKSGYDHIRKCPLIDINEFRIAVQQIVALTESVCVIDTHISHHIKPKYTRMCILCTTPLKKLYARLKKRKYSKNKIRENLDSEIFEVCKTEALECGHTVIPYSSIDSKKQIKNIEIKIKKLL